MYRLGPVRKARHLARGIQQNNSSLPDAAWGPQVKQGTLQGALTFITNLKEIQQNRMTFTNIFKNIETKPNDTFNDFLKDIQRKVIKFYYLFLI